MGKKKCKWTPVQVTEIKEVFVRKGVLYGVFLSGKKEYAVSMGPAMALEAIELARRALQGGEVLEFKRSRH